MSKDARVAVKIFVKKTNSGGYWHKSIIRMKKLNGNQLKSETNNPIIRSSINWLSNWRVRDGGGGRIRSDSPGRYLIVSSIVKYSN